MHIDAIPAANTCSGETAGEQTPCACAFIRVTAAVNAFIKMDEAQRIQKTLARIESFLLPPSAAHLGPSRDPQKDFPSTPTDRLDQILYQLAVAEHVRVMQTIYRDSFDEYSIATELRGAGSKDKLPTKALLQKLLEGRTRAMTLVKLCCGPQSIAMVKAFIDLANAYALQGMWAQAEERILLAIEKLVEVEAAVKSNPTLMETRSLALSAAERVRIVLSSLRRHVVANGGQVCGGGWLKELAAAFGDIISSSGTDDSLSHPSKLFASLAELFSSSASKLPLKQLTKSYFADQHTLPKQQQQQQQSKEEVKTWGDVVDFLRNKCVVHRSWMTCAQSLLLPQTKALLCLPFRLCDPHARSLAHPLQLAAALQAFPSVVRVTSGAAQALAKALALTKAEVPLLINAHAGSLQHLPLPQHTPEGVYYELPLTYEEYLCVFLQECSPSLDSQLSALKVSVLTLKGVCSLHLNHLPLAEEVLLNALQELEGAGLDMEAVACELYNSIAQMMITKYNAWLAGRKQRFEAEAEAWATDTEDGRRAVRVQLRGIKKQHTYQSQPMATAEMELLARDQAIHKRIKSLNDEQEDNEAMKQSLQAAYRYLIKSFEIAEAAHGPVHPVTGTACLAVASVQNLLKDFESTREWLLRAIRVFEKCSPAVERAVTFAQAQLSHALTKLGHEDEARRVLNKAAQYHLSRARSMLDAHLSRRGRDRDREDEDVYEHKPETARSAGSGRSRQPQPQPQPQPAQSKAYDEQLWPLILKGSALHDEVTTAATLLGQVVKMSVRVGEKWEASLLSEEIARLLEDAYGWDSAEAAEAYRQLGVRCSSTEDWPRAVRFLKISLQAHEALYSKTDARYLSTAKLLEDARRSRQQGAQGLPQGQQAEDKVTDAAAVNVMEGSGSPKGQAQPVTAAAEEEEDEYGDGEFLPQSPRIQ